MAKNSIMYSEIEVNFEFNIINIDEVPFRI